MECRERELPPGKVKIDFVSLSRAAVSFLMQGEKVVISWKTKGVPYIFGEECLVPVSL